ncbi:hypothetical protein S7711_05398 [Stachybotrys chartarum IBT 7711]|uniref:Protein SDS23 n=1 Tax=Stachybotrys chartarum (strain CBS 109288 / IBT 7711) TaxID=1280523 RepID=A0A084AHG7_STACB|nr:hypothetical protein S7711_05398 [Stachybotrys chartarum IBT 7711]KFA53016.1 hypothetical protein S40293_05910 [Stachybotrys chartarum IBT 40293]
MDSLSPTTTASPRDYREASPLSLSSNSSSSLSAKHKLPPLQPTRATSSSSNNRLSFVEGLRQVPPSPREHRVRHSSFSHPAIQDLISHPPSNKPANPKFAGREWRDIAVGEILNPDDVKWVELDSSVEDATMVLLKSPPNVVLIRENSSAKTAISTFDFNDLNTYLLMVTGIAKPEEDQISIINAIRTKSQQGNLITIRDIQPLCRKETLVNLTSDSNLAQGIEVLGSGIHQFLVTDNDGDVTGIVSQLQVIEFFWSEGVNFPTIDRLYALILRDLGVGSQQIISINSDAPLSDALRLMNDEGLTSVAVVDNGQNVVGNISTRDVRHLTSTASAPLLGASCMHFISYILNEKGVEKGRDAVPVFHVTPYSTLAHTVAKLVATKSHRMWVVDSGSPSPSAPSTPLLGPSHSAHAMPLSPVPSSAVPASAMAGARISGRLNGVISLTDILNLFAKFSGLHPADPWEQRMRRRRSSSGSIRPTTESGRPSSEIRR